MPFHVCLSFYVARTQQIWSIRFIEKMIGLCCFYYASFSMELWSVCLLLSATEKQIG